MDDHTQFLAAPPISSPPLVQPNPSSKLQYTSYGLQTYMHPSPLSNPRHSTRIPLPPVRLRPNTMPKRLNPTTPNPSPLIPHMCSPCTHPSPKQHHPNTRPRFFLVPSLIRPRNICSLALTTSLHTRMHSYTNSMPATGRRSRPRPSLRPPPAPDPRAAAMASRAFQVAPLPARAVWTQTHMPWAEAAAAAAANRRHHNI